MRTLFPGGALLALALLLTGCGSPQVTVSTFQDPAQPLGRGTPLAFSDTPPADVESRLATEDLRAEMRAQGFNLVAWDQAQYTVRCEAKTKDQVVPRNSGASVGVGAGGGSSMGGSGFGFGGVGVGVPVGSQTKTEQMTEVRIVVETRTAPVQSVWQANLAAKLDDQQAYGPAFYRPALAHFGENFSGSVGLKKADPPRAPPP